MCVIFANTQGKQKEPLPWVWKNPPRLSSPSLDSPRRVFLPAHGYLLSHSPLFSFLALSSHSIEKRKKERKRFWKVEKSRKKVEKKVVKNGSLWHFQNGTVWFGGGWIQSGRRRTRNGNYSIGIDISHLANFDTNAKSPEKIDYGQIESRNLTQWRWTGSPSRKRFLEHRI